jgi:hypothetical protein
LKFASGFINVFKINDAYEIRVGTGGEGLGAYYRCENLIGANALAWRFGMQELEVKRYLQELPTTTESARAPLDTRERIVRIMVMTAFIAVLAVEAWLLWQVCQLF